MFFFLINYYRRIACGHGATDLPRGIDLEIVIQIKCEKGDGQITIKPAMCFPKAKQSCKKIYIRRVVVLLLSISHKRQKSSQTQENLQQKSDAAKIYLWICFLSCRPTDQWMHKNLWVINCLRLEYYGWSKTPTAVQTHSNKKESLQKLLCAVG